jgi:O-antigen/teichoic acid export membrane protein
MLNAELLKSERFRRLSKEGFWIVLGQALLVLASLAGVRILTGLLRPAAYGELALGLTLATLVNQTVMGPLAGGATRFYAPAVEKGELGGYLKAVRRLMLRATAWMALPALAAAAAMLMTGQGKWLAIGFAGFVFAVLSGYNYTLSGIQDAARQRSVVALHAGMNGWAQYLFAAGLILLFGASSTAALAGYSLAATAVLGSQFYFFRKTILKGSLQSGNEQEWGGRILGYSWPLMSWGIFTWAQLASDRWALGLFRPMQDLGAYVVLYQLGYSPISVITGMGVQFLAPIYYQRAGDASDSLRNADVNRLNQRLSVAALGVTGLCFLADLLLRTPIFRIFVAGPYRGVSYLLPWMALSAGLFATGQIISINLMSQMRTRSMVTAKIATALLGAAANFAGAYFFGINGVVGAGVLFSLAYFLWMTALLRDGAGTNP